MLTGTAQLNIGVSGAFMHIVFNLTFTDYNCAFVSVVKLFLLFSLALHYRVLKVVLIVLK